MGYEERRSKYYYEDQDILINKMDIKDAELLNEYERRIVSLKLLIIDHASFSGKFDAKMLKEIHNYLFSEIYDFAGEYREENLAKDDFRFASCEFIESELERVLSPLEDIESYRNMSRKEISEKLASVLSEINVIHPFREGNGRTYREFIREFAEELGWKLDWAKCEYDEIFEASLKSVYDTDDLAKVIYKCLSKAKNSSKDGKESEKASEKSKSKVKEKLSKAIDDAKKAQDLKKKRMTSSDKIKILDFADEKKKAQSKKAKNSKLKLIK